MIISIIVTGNGGSELTWYEQNFLSIHWCRATHTCKLRYERRV